MMLGRLLEGKIGQVLAPDPIAAAIKNKNNVEDCSIDDEKVYMTPPKKSARSTESTSVQKSWDKKKLENAVLEAAVDTSRLLASPTLVWESRKKLFDLCASQKQLKEKQLLKFENKLKSNPSLASSRAAHMLNIAPDGFTLLHTCAASNNVILAEFLLNLKSSDCNLNIISVLTPDLQGRTALHVACEKGHVEMARLLKRHLTEELGDLPPIGEDAPVDLIGRTPLGWAMTSREASKNSEQLKDELFSPGDASINPKTPSSIRCSSLTSIDYGFSELPGWRVNMEDSLCCVPSLAQEISLFGVFDGHSDNGVFSKYLSHNIPKLFLRHFENSKNIEKALYEVCIEADANLKLLKDSINCGSTAVIAVVTSNSIVVANVGDSRSILVQEENSFKEMSQDHKPNIKSELRRIEAAGYEVVSDNNVNWQVQSSSGDKLSMSRSFGDFDFKSNASLKENEQAVIAIPDIITHNRSKKDNLLVLASDGLFDVMTNQEVADFLSNKYNQQQPSQLASLCDDLLNESFNNRNSKDNMSVIIVSVNQEGVHDHLVVKALKGDFDKDFE